MAFQNAEAIQKLYVAFFNRPADYYGLQYWDGVVAASKNPEAVIASLAKSFSESKEYTDTYAGQNTREIINNIYKNLFGRPAEEKGLEYWYGEVNSGRVTLSNAVLMIRDGAQNADKVAYASKVTAATAFTDALDTTDERLGYKGEKANAVAKQFLTTVTDEASLATAIAPANLDAVVNSSIGAGTTAQTFNLTKGLDNIPGTAGNDVILGSISTNPELNTLSSLDVINGGTGVDTLKIFDEIGSKITLPGVSSVEIIEVTGVGGEGANIDTTANTDVTNVNVVKSSAGATVKAAGVTDVSVAGVYGEGLGKITVDGGKNVTVNNAAADKHIIIGTDTASKGTVGVVTNLINGSVVVEGGTDVNVSATSKIAGDNGETGDIRVGALNKAASGNVVIVSNLNSDGTVENEAGDIVVFGGKTVSITANATDVAKDTTATNGVTMGNIDVTGDGKTTTVTIKQTASVTDASTAAVGGVKESNSIKFGALVKGDSVTVGGLTFTATQDLTGAQVAAAFANLTTTDTQSATGPVKNGIYTGKLVTGWNSAAANGDTVVFTSTASTPANVTDLAVSTTNTSTKSVAAVPTKTEGQAPTTAAAETENEITFGKVTVNDKAGAASITTVSIDGYQSATIGKADGVLTKLNSLSLANSDGNAVAFTGATQFALNVNSVGDNVSIDGGAATVTDLTLTASGAKSAFELTAAAVKNLTVDAGVALDIHGSTIGSGNALQTVAVKGAGAVNLGTVVSTGLKSFDASANTGGVTATVSANSAQVDAALKTYTFSQGADVVTLNSSTVDVAINLGAGDDKITLANGTTALTKVIDGGTGTNTLVMAAADAQAATVGTDFASKVDNFQKLGVKAIADAGNYTVNLANMDGISYVVSAGANNAAGSFETTNVTFTALRSGQSVTVAGRTVTAGAGDLTAAQVEAAFLSGASAGAATVTGTLTGWTVANNGTGAAATDGILKFTATTGGDKAPISTSVQNAAAAATPTVSVTDGTPVGTTAENGVVKFESLGAGQSVTVAGVTITNTGSASVTGNDVAKALAGETVADLNVVGNLTASGWTVTSVIGANATLTATSLGNVSDFQVSSNDNDGDPLTSGTYASVISRTQGVDGTREKASVTFTALTSGQSVTVAGRTVTATAGDMTAADVAAAFASLTDTANHGTVTGSFAGYTAAQRDGATLVLEATAVGNAPNLTVAAPANGTATVVPTISDTVDGGVGGGSGTGTLTLTNMANNGTLEITGSGNKTTVTMTDATGTSDVFNIVTKVDTASINGGIVNVAGVETLNITSTDSVTTSIDTVTLTIAADSAKTVNVAGNANTTLVWDAASTKVTLVDASTATGKLVAETLVGGTMTVKGGAAADTLTTYGQQDVLQGGAGADTLVVKAGANLAMLTGGAGNDTFKIDGASTNVNNAATITDLSAGDKIVFAGANAFTSKAITLDTTAVFQDFANTAIKNLAQGEMGWFQFGGNTYIVQDVSNSTTAFQNGVDMIVKITGQVDLSNASYNATSNFLEFA